MKAPYAIAFEEGPKAFRISLQKRKNLESPLFVFGNFYEGFDHLKELSHRLGTLITSSGSDRYKQHYIEFIKDSVDEVELLQKLEGKNTAH